MRVRLNHKRLLQLIAESKLSQNHWAMRLGLSRGHWSGIVNGKHPYPSQKTRAILLDAFGVPFEDLFSHESHAGIDAEFQSELAGRYLLEKEIGQGGMGTVYLARDIRLARYVALKVVSTEAVSGIGIEQFLKEIRLTARLQHPNILPVHDAGEAAGAPYYVMPWIEGGSLRRRLELDGAIDFDRALRIIQGIALGLRHAHDRQVLHCDVKPENILLTGDHPFVADFGIARAIHAESAVWGRRSELDSSAGTPAYVSPEQVSGESTLDARSDVYSLGCVTYEMLTGVRPFDGQTTMETVAKRFVDVPKVRKWAPHIPTEAAQIVEQAMNLSPDQRPQTTSGFAASLTEAKEREQDGFLVKTTAPLIRAVSATKRLLPSPPKSFSSITDALRSDVRFALRTIKRSPVITFVMIATLTLGMGINTAVFAVVNGVLLRPLPYENGDDLVFTWATVQRGAALDTTTVNPSDFMDWRTQSSSFTDMAAFNVWLPTVSNQSGAERVSAGIVTPNFFDLLGVRPMIGSGFMDSHVESADGRVTVLSYAFWQRWFGGDNNAVGQTLMVGGQPYEIVGVMPDEYRHVDPSRGFGRAEFWAPISIAENAVDRSSLYLRSIARLREGASATEAQAELQTIAGQLEAAYPASNTGRSAVVVPVRTHHFASVRPALLTILVASGFVLLIVCANVATLVLARSQSRRREFAVRASLGAGNRRLARQLVIEQLALTLPGAAFGLAAVMLGTRAFASIQESYMSRIAVVSVDWRVVVFGITIALLVATAFGFLSVGQLRSSSFRDILGEESTGSGSSRATHVFRSTLVISQIALAAALLIGAGVLTRSFVNLLRVPTGFSTENILTFETIAPNWRFQNAAAAVPFFQQLSGDIESIPGVERVGMISDLPFTTENRFSRYNRVDRPIAPENVPSIEYHHVGTGYFETTDIAVVRGRGFTEADREGATPVVVLNESGAGLYWSDGDALGRQLSSVSRPESGPYTVIGIVADVLDDGLNSQPEPRAYFPFLQAPSFRMSFLVKSRVDPSTLVPAIRDRVRTLEPDAAVGSVTTFEDLVSASVSGERVALQLATLFSFFAVALAAVGIYGLMAFVVGARKRELGIRTALGAESGDVLKLVLKQSLGFTVVGILLGWVLGAATTRLLAALLFGVPALDPITFLGAPLLLGGVALLASYIPARRASNITPMVALRTD